MSEWRSDLNTPVAVLVAHEDLTKEQATAFASQQLIAWDIETSGLDWRNDRLGTCQLFAEGIGAVVVQLGNGVPVQLAGLLETPNVKKVFHHAPFDLRFMVYWWGVQPQSILCTKVASKLLTPRAPNEEHSLRYLLMRHLGVALDKGSVRTSDWTVKNLSEEQIDYAARDVIFLPPLLRALQNHLGAAGLLGLYGDCCNFLPARVALEIGGYPDVFAY